MLEHSAAAPRSFTVAMTPLSPARPSDARTERRLLARATPRLEPGETVVAWCRAWYSRPVRLRAFAARYRDFVLLTDRRLLMWSSGAVTRAPRRRILADRLADLRVTPARRNERTVHIDHPSHPAMILEFGRDAAGAHIAAALQALPTADVRSTDPHENGASAWPS